MREVKITRIDVQTKTTKKMTDHVAEEKPLFVFLNKNHYATILCSPADLRGLVVGHLLAEGIIKTLKDIERLDLKEGVCNVRLTENVDLRKRLKLSGTNSRVILSACGSPSPYQYIGKLPKIRSNLTLEAEVLSDCVNRLNSAAKTFRKTGGVHAAAIHRADGTVVAFAEDVGRHNAVDKVIGVAASDEADFSKCFLILSGRLTADIVRKAARVGLPIVASLAAAIDSGIETANVTRLTLVGFVRGRRMNVYTVPERIIP
jgi:FdhD protein